MDSEARKILHFLCDNLNMRLHEDIDGTLTVRFLSLEELRVRAEAAIGSLKLFKPDNPNGNTEGNKNL